VENLLILTILFALILSTTPIPAALGLTSFICFSFFFGQPILVLGKGSFEYLNNFSFTAVLFFIIMGAIMTVGTSARRLIDFVNTLVGFLPGGMAISAVGVCMLFGAISGSAIATLVAVGAIMVPAMVERGYAKEFAVGLLTSSAELGILVPPSIPMIILALTINISVGRIFLAGYLPALLFGVTYSIYCYFYARKKDIPREAIPSMGEIWQKFKACFGAVILILLIAVGIYGGIFTASEAAAVGTVYAIVLELFIYRSISLKGMAKTIIDATETVGPLMFIVVGASFFGEFITIEMIPQKITTLIVGSIQSPFFFLIMMNVVLLFAGMFIDMLSSIIIISPVLMPVAARFGIDPIHFGIIYIFNMGIGYITPPVGLDLYVSMGLFKMSLNQLIRACLPFFLILGADLMIVTYVPAVSLFVPNLFMGIVR
jgi:C4-dicarboxylate transporter DctM subunit